MEQQPEKSKSWWAEFNEQNKNQDIVTMPGKIGVYLNYLMLFCFSIITIVPILLMLVIGPGAQLFLVPFGFFMVLGYWKKIKQLKMEKDVPVTESKLETED